MLRINLLPPYIHDKSKRRAVVAAWAVGLALVAGGFLLWASNINRDLEAANTAKTEADGLKSQTDSEKAATAKIKTEIAETQTKQEFIAAAQKSNDAWPATYEKFRDLCQDRIILRSLQMDASQHQA